ncbi:MAG: glutathione S-transferase family protein [Myxococcales bacterium]|nr:glutathione S-transferase family protein [Myxococcales bacterium]
MSKPKLTYFDAPVSRGEECRLALTLAGVDFEDVRLKSADWATKKAQTPFGALPVYDEPGKPSLGQSNAILGHVGRAHGLHPQDPFEAARHEAVMQHVEDLRLTMTPSLRMKDDAEKKKAREVIAATYLPAWAGYAAAQIAGPFVAGAKIHVADIKLAVVTKWFVSGAVDHIPTTVFADHPKLLGLYEAFYADPRVVAWYARS